MRSRDIPPRAHHRRALRLVLGAFVLLVLGGMAFACYSLSFLWTEHSDADQHEGHADGSTVRSFYEMDDDGQARIEADLELALGRVTATRAEAGALFQAEVDILEGLRPRFEQSTSGGAAAVELGLYGGSDVPLGRVRSSGSNAWRLYFSDRTPLDLNLALGAADADLDFSGIPLARLDLDCGMSKANVRFTEPNPIVMDRMEIEAGLTEFTVSGLGFARFQRFEFDGGAGDFTLDFTGDAFEPGASAEVDVGMASLTILLPSGQPVLLEANDSFMTNVDVPASFARLGDGHWSSAGAENDRRAFRLEVDSGPGSVTVRLVE